MNKRLFYRLLLDVGLFILLLLLLAYPLTDYHIHEVIGLAFILLIIKHNIDNRGWYKSLFKGKYSLNRLLHNIVNIILICLILINFIAAIGISLWIFQFLPFDFDEAGRVVHVVTAYWITIFIALHIGFHWDKLLAIAKKHLPFKTYHPKARAISQILLILIASYGVYATIKLAMIDRLLGYSSYFFWDESQSAILFFIDYLAFLILCVSLTYFGLKRLTKRKLSGLGKK